MRNGLYSLCVIRGPLVSHGIVILRERCMNGGDAEHVYQGVFGQEGSRIAGELSFTDLEKDKAGRPLALMLTTYRVMLTGATDSGGFHMVGHGRQGTIIEVNGRRLAELTEPCELSPEVRGRLGKAQSGGLA